MLKTIQKKYRNINILIFICAMVCLVCYDIKSGLWLKGLTSLWFVLLGGINTVYARKCRMPDLRPVYFIFAGLVLGMMADVRLAVVFEAGIAFFALGHIMYMAAFYIISGPQKKDFAFILPLCAVSVFVVVGAPFITVEDPFISKFLVVYAVIISFMVGKAISNFTAEKTMALLLIAISSVMFWFSDLVLAVDMFGTSSRLTWILCSYVYWPGQNLLAHALFHMASRQAGLRVHHNTTRLNVKY